MTDLGFDRPLYILPFDHRGSFQSGLFGWKGDAGLLEPSATVLGSGTLASRYAPIGEYGVIGDLYTVALVGMGSPPPATPGDLGPIDQDREWGALTRVRKPGMQLPNRS